MKNLGGLSKYWGAGFFTDKTYKDNKELFNFINKNFNFYKIANKNYFNLKFINLKFFKFLHPNFLVSSSNKEKLLNSGYEIIRLYKLSKK